MRVQGRYLTQLSRQKEQQEQRKAQRVTESCREQTGRFLGVPGAGVAATRGRLQGQRQEAPQAGVLTMVGRSRSRSGGCVLALARPWSQKGLDGKPERLA